MQGHTYDLHLTVDPRTFNAAAMGPLWKLHDIQNVQGIPHLIVSQKYTGHDFYGELQQMADKLEKNGVYILRRKIELHFSGEDTNAEGIVEIHYKCRNRGVFFVPEEHIGELNRKKLAFSFNMSTARQIVSARFLNLNAWRKGKASDPLPDWIEEEEREIVIMDTNQSLDSFWPMRTGSDEKLSFASFPLWVAE